MSLVEVPLIQHSNLLLLLHSVYVYPKCPDKNSEGYGPLRALIDTGASCSWISPTVGELLDPYPIEDLVSIDTGDGAEEQIVVEVKQGFLKGTKGKPVKGWLQLDKRVSAYYTMLMSGDFNMSYADIVVGMDILSLFDEINITIEGGSKQLLSIKESD